MTVLVGIRCTDGVVVAADSASTFTTGHVQTISHPTRKIDIVGGQVIIAGTGAVGLSQRFRAVVDALYTEKKLKGSELDWVKAISGTAQSDFGSTNAPKNAFGALVAFMNKESQLCEFELSGFQPEMKTDRCWYVSMGSGQMLADAYLALMRASFWRDGNPPNLIDGVFAAAWVMRNAIRAAPGMVREPIDIAVLSAKDRRAKLLEKEELQEHLDRVDASMAHFSSFKTQPGGSEIATPALPAPLPGS